MHEVLVNRLGGLSLPRKSVVRLTDRPDMTLDVYRGRKTTIQQKDNRKRGWMDDLRFYALFNSISVILGRWAHDSESLCATESRLRLRRFRLERGSNSRPIVGQRLTH